MVFYDYNIKDTKNRFWCNNYYGSNVNRVIIHNLIKLAF